MTVVYHPEFEKHVQHPGHPECPERLTASVARLKEEGLFSPLSPQPASDDDLGLVHKKDYVERIKNFGEGYYDSDTYVRPETYRIAALAAGGALLGARLALKEGKASLALLRPPGHHAGAGYAGGFCYFNNAAIAAQWAAKQGHRVAIVDIDVHHGNGTADIFKDRKDVLYVSTHQWGIYPGTGKAADVGIGAGKGYTVNVPLSAGCGDATFDAAFSEVIEPVIRQFAPEMVVVSIGGDSHYRDPLGNLTLSSKCYRDLAGRLIALGRGKCAFVLEGGYDLEAMADIAAGVAAPCQGKDVKLRYNEVIDTECAGKAIVKEVAGVQKAYWKL